MKTIIIFTISLFVIAFSYGQNINSSTKQLEGGSLYDKYSPSDELKEMNTANARFFKNKDGSTSMFINSGNSLNYNNGKSWEPISTKITENISNKSKRNVYKFANTTNSFKSFYSEKPNDGIVSELKDGEIVEFLDPNMVWLDANNNVVEKVNASASKGQVVSDKFEFANLYSQIDARFTQLNGGRKLDYILKQPDALSARPMSATSLAFYETINLPKGWSIQTKTGGVRAPNENAIVKIYILNQTGDKVASYSIPFYYDNKISGSNKRHYAEYLISQIGNTLQIGTVIPVQWLISSDRNYPITIDPTLNVYTTNSANWTGSVYDDGDKYDDEIWFGYEDGSYNYWLNAWAKFDLNNATLTGQTITAVKLHMYKYEHYIGDDYSSDVNDVQYSIGPLMTNDPVIRAGSSLYSDIEASSAYASYTDRTQDALGWWIYTLGSTAATNATSRIGTWYALAINATNATCQDCNWFWDDGNKSYYYGFSSANRPYLELTYCTQPTANAGVDKTATCGANSVTMAATAPVAGQTGLWTISSGCSGCTFSDATSSTTTVSNIPTSGTNTLKWTINVTDGGCSASDLANVINNTPTTPNAGTDGTTCTGTYSLAGNTPTSGTGAWTVTTGTGIFAPSNISPNATVSDLTGATGGTTNTFTWTITLNGCALSDAVNIVYYTLPSVEAGTVAAGCYNTATCTMAATAAPGGCTGTWSVISGTGTFTSPNSATTTVTNVGIGSNTYRWTLVNAALCTSADNVVVVNNSPSTANAGTDQTIAANSTSMLANTPLQGTGTWTFVSSVPAAGSYTITAPGTSSTNTITGLTTNYSYTFQWNITNGGCPASTDQVVIFYDAGQKGFIVQADLTTNGEFSQQNDPNYFIMNGSSSSILGTTSTYTLPKLKVYGGITFDGIITSGKFDKLLVVSTYNFTVKNARTFKNTTFINNGTSTLQSNSIFENSGDWTNSNVVSWADATPIVKFNGAGNTQLVTTNYAGSQKYKNIVIDNKDGANIPGTVRLIDEMPISTTATFTYGVVDGRTNSKYFTVEDNATVTGASDNSFVNGTVKKIGNDNFKYPTGSVRTPAHNSFTYVCGEAGIDNSAGAVGDIYYATYRYYSTLEDPIHIDFWTNGSNMGTGLHHTSEVEYWDITTSTTNYRNVTIYTNSKARSGITDLTDLTLAHWETSKWEDRFGSGAAYGSTGYYLTSSGLTSYSPITFASKSGYNQLPIELLKFTGDCNDKFIDLNWSTASEINNDYFIIEKSYDAIQWYEVTRVTGSGNSSEIKKYQYLDKVDLLNKNIYYRLIQVDFDGRINIYNTISSSCDGIASSFSYSIYPNPANDNINISIHSTDAISCKFIINNDLGQQIETREIIAEKGINEFSINTSNYALGVYYISIISNNTVYPFKQFVIAR